MIVTDHEIQMRVIAILDQVIGESVSDKESLTPEEKLGIILSESLQSLVYVTAIEDEFDIEIEDDQIDIDLFENIDVTVEKIKTLLTNKQSESNKQSECSTGKEFW